MWKLQTIVQMQPRVRTRESLPTPPYGMDWTQNEDTKEWKLVANSLLSSSSSENKRPPRAPTTEEHRVVFDGIPFSGGEEKFDDDDWDLLSEKISVGSMGTTVVVTPSRSGSVRSINSLDNSSTALSIPFRIQRTLSSSTIDSCDGDRALGVNGVDFVEHIVVPSDTLQGVCLAYKISATRLRQVNGFSGSGLNLAPKKLIVPLSKKAIRSGFIKIQDQDSREYKIHAFLAELPALKESEAQAYLEMADWVVSEAVGSAKEDGEWEKECAVESKSGDIQITVKLKDGLPVDLQTIGAGLKPQPKSPNTKPVRYDGLPAIATKNVRPQDVYNAAPQHQGFGVELQEIEASPQKIVS